MKHIVRPTAAPAQGQPQRAGLKTLTLEQRKQVSGAGGKNTEGRHPPQTN